MLKARLPRRVGQAELRAFLFDRLGLRGPFWSAEDAATSLPGLGMVQIDSIRVTGLRNQELAWLARADAPPAAFYDLLYCQGMMLETHYPLFATRRDWLPHLWAGFADMPARYRAERQEFRPVMRRVLRHIRDNGPATAADFAAERVPGGFNTVKATTKALEFLFTDRVLQIAGRTPHFHRAFDLTERVAPELLGWRRPPVADLRRFVVDSALAVLKIATSEQIAQRAALHHGQWRGQVLKPMRALVDRLLPEAARAVTVADLPGEPFYWYRAEDEIGWERAARAVASPSRIVPPLDNLLFSRKRFSALFGFDYKFEAYTPAADRRFYFALPLIQDGDVIGLVDARARDGTWELVGLELRRPAALDELRQAVHRLAGFAGAERVTATSGLGRAERRALTGKVAP
jgi:uncharacterized protein YcaQ